jgi:hypothetical protein
MKDGSEFYSLVTVPKGEPENMLTREEIRSKFDYLVTPVIGAEAAARLYDTVMNLEAGPSVDGYFSAASRDRQSR